MFDIDILQTNPNTPTFFTALITVSFAFFLLSLIAMTYEFTNKEIYKNAQFLQAMALISIVASTIMLAVGDSLAVGLGMLGALSIIRFRTAMNNPRNITFIFASLAAGIACGILGFSIALTGTLIFCSMCILLYYSPWGNINSLTGSLYVRYNYKDFDIADTEAFVGKTSKKHQLSEIKTIDQLKKRKTENDIIGDTENERIEELVYLIRLNNIEDISIIVSNIKELRGVEKVRFSIKNTVEKL